MTTVAILPISDVNGEKAYRAIAGDKYSVGKPAGQALDALTAQLDKIEFSALLVIQSFRPDSFFSAEQQERLSELMNLWRLTEIKDRNCRQNIIIDLSSFKVGENRWDIFQSNFDLCQSLMDPSMHLS